MVRLVTVTGLPVAVPVRPPPLEVQVAVYAVMAAPPVLAGAVNARLALASPAVATTLVGAPGTWIVGVVGVFVSPPPLQASMPIPTTPSPTICAKRFPLNAASPS